MMVQKVTCLNLQWTGQFWKNGLYQCSSKWIPLWNQARFKAVKDESLTLLHSEWPKLHRVLAILSAVGLICCTEDKVVL